MKEKSGFTLVEIMIAIAVTMIALATAVLILRDSTRANSNVTQTADMSDNMRAGLNLIVQDLIQNGTGIPTGGISIPNTAHAGCNVILPAIEPGNGLGPAVTSPDGTTGPRTDIITIMYSDNTLAMDQKPII